MNFIEFTFEKLFESSDFERYESPELRTALTNMNDFICEKFPDYESRAKFDKLFGNCCICAMDSSFEHGFRFAANLVKSILKA